MHRAQLAGSYNLPFNCTLNQLYLLCLKDQETRKTRNEAYAPSLEPSLMFVQEYYVAKGKNILNILAININLHSPKCCVFTFERPFFLGVLMSRKCLREPCLPVAGAHLMSVPGTSCCGFLTGSFASSKKGTVLYSSGLTKTRDMKTKFFKLHNKIYNQYIVIPTRPTRPLKLNRDFGGYLKSRNKWFQEKMALLFF